MTVEIKLSMKGKHAGKYVAIVDDCDSDFGKLRYSASIRKNTVYARNIHRKFLHREIIQLILGRPLEKGEVVDHINGDGLDNRRSNLRVVTHTQNMRNRHDTPKSKTGRRGVYFHPKVGKYQARIRFNGKLLNLGLFETLEQGYQARCEAERKYYNCEQPD